MTGNEAAKPKTLMEVHEELARIRPRLKAPLGEWLAYYRRSAAWYAEVAEIDRGHHHEALFMAEQAQDSAKEIEAQLPMQRRETKL
ncbi:MAG: AMED_5909 family protein [Pseudonocardiaceae bacterium]